MEHRYISAYAGVTDCQNNGPTHPIYDVDGYKRHTIM